MGGDRKHKVFDVGDSISHCGLFCIGSSLGWKKGVASSFKSSIGLLSAMPFELDPEEADLDDSLAVDSFTFWEEQAVASERIAAAPRIAKYVFFIVHYQPFF